MNNSFFARLLIACLTITSTVKLNIAQAQGSKNIYSCINNNGVPTTVVDTKRGRIELIVWQSNYFSSSGWNPEKRCKEVTARFQKYYNDGSLKYITTGKLRANTGGEYKVICVSSQKAAPGENIKCNHNGLLITLEPDDDPQTVMKDLFRGAARVGGMPIRRGQYILDIEKYLEIAPLIENKHYPSNSINNSDTLDATQPETKPSPATVIDCPSILCD